MKKHFLILLLLLSIPVVLHSVNEEGLTITKLSMEPIPFNERRDPVTDSPYNAFDGDLKTTALYSDFTIEFNKPAAIDQIKIMNGNVSASENFKRDNRERDIEITLYTVAIKSDKKVKVKSIKTRPKKQETKKEPVNDKDIKIKDSKDKTLPEKKEENEKDKNEIKKSATPEKVVQIDEFEILNRLDSRDYSARDDVKFYLTASETAVEPEKKISKEIKPDKVKEIIPVQKEKAGTKKAKGTPVKKKPVDKKLEKKSEKKETKKTEILKSEKNNNVKTKTVIKKSPEKNVQVKAESKKAAPKTEKKPVTNKEKRPEKNIIEIIDSKKENKKIEKTSTDAVKKSEEIKKELKPENVKKDAEKTDLEMNSAVEDETVKIEPDTTVEKVSLPVIKKTEQKKKKKVTAENKSKKVKAAAKKSDANKIEITDSKDKSVKGKLPADKEKSGADKKAVKSETKKKDVDKLTDKKTDSGKEDKILKKKEIKKEVKNEVNKKEIKKTEQKKSPVDVKVKKMTGVVKVENDPSGRVMVYTSLKDSAVLQNIDLKGGYAVTKIEFRTRDDEYYAGSVPDRSAISEISFLNNGKIIPVQGIDALKKSYAMRYDKTLTGAISGETFIMNENGDVSLRVKFGKDGSIVYYDRFKCAKKGDADCTYLSMPDRWRVTEGKLLMRYHTLWRVWKYELDSQSDMLSDEEQPAPRWMKIYFKSDTGFTDKYLDLVRSENGVWAE